MYWAVEIGVIKYGLVTTKSFIVLPSEVRLLINSVISFFVEPNWEFEFTAVTMRAQVFRWNIISHTNIYNVE